MHPCVPQSVRQVGSRSPSPVGPGCSREGDLHCSICVSLGLEEAGDRGVNLAVLHQVLGGIKPTEKWHRLQGWDTTSRGCITFNK